MDEYKYHSMISAANAEDLIIEIGNQELIQKPHIMLTCWGPVLQKDLPRSKDVDHLYQKVGKILAASQNLWLKEIRFTF